MPEIKIKLSEPGERAFRAALKSYAKELGLGVEEVIDETAAETAKRIAARTQPYGLGKGKTEQFGRSIAAQAHRALLAANLDGATGNPRSEHNKRRDRKGHVHKNIRTDGQWKGPGISPAERNQYVDRVVRRAGMEKAAWLDAGRKAWSKLVISSYFRNKLKLGFSNKFHSGMRREVHIGHVLRYSSIDDAALKAAIRSGRGTMLGKMKRLLAKRKTI